MRLARKSGTDWTPSSSPTELVARFSFWACVLLGLIIGVSAFDTSYATGTPLPISLLPYLTHAVGAALLLVAGILIARFLARSVLISAVNAQLQYARVLSLGVKWLVLVLTAAMVLDHLEVGGNIVELAFGILFGGIVLTLALAVGLGSRDLVSRSLESHVEHTGERRAHSGGAAQSRQDDPAFLSELDRQSRRQYPAAARSHLRAVRAMPPRCEQYAGARAERWKSLLRLAQIAEHADASAFHAQPLLLFVEGHARVPGLSIVQARSASSQANQGAIPCQHLRVAGCSTSFPLELRCLERCGILRVGNRCRVPAECRELPLSPF